MMLRRSPTLDLAAAVEAVRANGRRAFSLSTPTFPDRAAELDMSRASTLLSSAMGLEELRIRARAALLQKWRLVEHDVIITVGAKAAIFAALRVACTPGDRVLIVSPHWPSYEDLAQILFLQPVSLQSKFAEDFTLSAGNLASLVDASGAKAIVLSNPNNPTGRIHSAEEITALWEVARAREILLLIDESFSGVIFDQEKWRSSTCLPYQKLVVVSSFSKSHRLQGLRVGVALAHKELLDEMTAAHQTVLSATPTPSQAAVMAFLEGEGQPVDYRRQRRAALDFVHSQGWSCLAAEGSFYLFPRVAEVDAFHARAKERDVFVLRGSAFGACYTDHIRLCFGKPMAELEETFSALNDTSV